MRSCTSKSQEEEIKPIIFESKSFEFLKIRKRVRRPSWVFFEVDNFLGISSLFFFSIHENRFVSFEYGRIGLVSIAFTNDP